MIDDLSAQTPESCINRSDIFRMARKAGAWNLIDHDGIAALERFAALVAAHEREECAKVCDEVAQRMDDEGEGPTGYIGWVDDCASNIRARGEK